MRCGAPITKPKQRPFDEYRQWVEGRTPGSHTHPIGQHIHDGPGHAHPLVSHTHTPPNDYYSWGWASVDTRVLDLEQKREYAKRALAAVGL